METYTQMSPDEAFFVADSHFRDRRLPGEAQRRRLFIEFLSRVPDTGAVFLLGDVFDFYFEYASVVSKRYFDIFHALYDCSSRGVDIHFLGGNHDCWFTDFLQDDLGITPHDEDVFAECQGRRIWCTHGDLLMPGDGNYKIVRSIIQNRFTIGAARMLIHPDLMDAIAARVSHSSKKRNRRSVRDLAHQLADRPAAEFFSKGNDVLVMGHIHYPLHRVMEGKDLMIVGDWITHFSFGRMREGRMSLDTFKHEETG
jgi:UDP-2,3-diacylglucosamine hydrolase